MEVDKVVVLFIPVRKRMMSQMKALYGDVLNFAIDGSKFFVNNTMAVRGQLRYSEVDIDPEKNPLFQFYLLVDFPDYCMSLRQK